MVFSDKLIERKRQMSPQIIGRIFNTTMNSVFKRFVVSLIRATLIYLIAFLFVHLPTFWNYVMTWGKNDQIRVKQKRTRAKLVDDEDSSSPYRAIDVINRLKTQPEDQIETLADIPQICAERFHDKETMGVRQILGVEDEKQPNGKVFKKYSLGEYQFRTYEQAFEQVEQIGKGLLTFGLKKGDRVLIYAETRPEWLLTAFACFRHGLTLVTLYSTLGEDALKHGINQSQVKVIITSHDLTQKLNVKPNSFLFLRFTFCFLYSNRKS